MPQKPHDNLEIVILAAGKGTRMYSDIPKVLHEIGGRPLLAHVLACARTLRPRRIHVVCGHGAEEISRLFPEDDLRWVPQAEQKGTGHAVMQALPAVADDARVLVLYGDVPLIRRDTLSALTAAANEGPLALLTAELPEPAGYGRIVRDSAGRVQRIVEEKDASDQELAISECNTGVLVAAADRLKAWVGRLGNDNSQGEYYLTDIIALAAAEGINIVTRRPRATWEIMGVNSKEELAKVERTFQNNEAEALMRQGVTLRDPARFDLRGELKAGRDVVIDVNVILEGKVELGDGVYIGPNNVIRNSTIAARSVIHPNCVIEDSVIGGECQVGPFARLRPGVHTADRVKIGNFVEVKNSKIGEGSKINHLSYVGDSIVGKNVNIGAGTITCNYDGANKHQTIIGDGAFIGSDVQLIAPVTVGAGATIGAGSTITRDCPADELTLGRAQQITKTGWKRPVKAEKREKSKEKS